MELADTAPFERASSREPATLLEAISSAKRIVHDMTGLPVDAVARCIAHEAGGWAIEIDVIEAAARLGDNDLLASYEMILNPHAGLTQFTRLRRYHREDQGQT